MGDEFTTTTTTSWGSRLGSSFKGIIGGIVLAFGAAGLLWWNEGNSVRTAKSLNEGQKNVVKADAGTAAPANEGKLVHISGRAAVDREISDPLFPAVRGKALRIMRAVEMYQWTEHQSSEEVSNVGGSKTTKTTYSYRQEWSGEVHSSAQFKQPQGHQNPEVKAVSDQTFTANKVTVGAFTLPAQLTDRLSGAIAFPMPEASAPAAPQTAVPAATQTPAAAPAPAAPQAAGDAITLPPEKPSAAVTTAVIPATPAATITLPAATLEIGGRIFQQTADGWYSGKNPAAPEVGDLRIRHTYIPEGDVSVIAAQNGTTFAPFATSIEGKNIFMISSGRKSAEVMFADARSANTTQTWLLRILGFAMMFMGLKMVFAPLTVLADVLPFLGQIASAGVSMVAGLLAFTGSLGVIGIAWLVYRPVYGIIMLVLAAAALVKILAVCKGRKTAAN